MRLIYGRRSPPNTVHPWMLIQPEWIQYLVTPALYHRWAPAHQTEQRIETKWTRRKHPLKIVRANTHTGVWWDAIIKLNLPRTHLSATAHYDPCRRTSVQILSARWMLAFCPSTNHLTHTSRVAPSSRGTISPLDWSAESHVVSSSNVGHHRVIRLPLCVRIHSYTRLDRREFGRVGKIFGEHLSADMQCVKGFTYPIAVSNCWKFTWRLTSTKFLMGKMFDGTDREAIDTYA